VIDCFVYNIVSRQKQDKVCEDQELLLVIKTQKDLVQELITAVKQNHPYTVPEVITMDITQGNENYLQWIHDSVKQPSQKQ